MTTIPNAIRGVGSVDEHARLLLGSYRRLTGRDLLALPEGQSPAQALEDAPLVILSHGTEVDPVLNYGNRRARELWEMTWETFVSTPSRLTAEPMEREAREAFLSQVRTYGYVDDYTGIRISSTGKRFYIQQATVWNLIDASGKLWGQAAAFQNHTYL
ncbi:MEKHLA domain-containing protein [Paenibacillus sp. 598K]|uniref:MEKHLA domain-containing protein n=1 Tax=Paenibacillus sp. 598K TaxID=1117987 RepID=UPI000FFA3270|nr:MEKHLA domain-containing protein [Paenibacillus sp. 598K]GBF77384.1 MEKHLA domain-containing protein [Paenibacillus sp. 598K]